MTEHEKLAVKLKLVAKLKEWADSMACVCVPYRGDTTSARHFSHCPWDSFMDGFLAACEAIGIEEPPTLVIKKVSE